MDKAEFYTKISDYLILNGYSKSNSGLYYGKAGIAIGLFELSRYLNDTRIEDHAFEILNQSLLSKSEFCDLDNGLSGIAFALKYLIENKFIEADPEELIGEKLDEIAAYIDSYSDEWQDNMDRLYSLQYAFSDNSLKLHILNLAKAENLWQTNTEELRNDFLKILKAQSPLTIELHRRFDLWIQWIKRAKQHNILFFMNHDLLHETLSVYKKTRNAGLLIDSPYADHFISYLNQGLKKNPSVVTEVKTIHDRIVESFCALNNSEYFDFNHTKDHKTQDLLQFALNGRNNTSSLKDGIIQSLMYNIAIEKPQERERLSELILLPNMNAIMLNSLVIK